MEVDETFMGCRLHRQAVTMLTTVWQGGTKSLPQLTLTALGWSRGWDGVPLTVLICLIAKCNLYKIKDHKQNLKYNEKNKKNIFWTTVTICPEQVLTVQSNVCYWKRKKDIPTQMCVKEEQWFCCISKTEGDTTDQQKDTGIVIIWSFCWICGKLTACIRILV